MTVRDIVRAHSAELHEHVGERARAAALLERAPITAWSELLGRDRALHTTAALHLLLDGARGELHRDAENGLRVIDAVLAVRPTDPVVRGRALRLQAYALHVTGEGARARETLDTAKAVLATVPAGALELLHARLFEAYLQNQTGEQDVLLEVRRIAKAFAAHGDATGALQTRLMEGAMLFERDEFTRATKVFRDAHAIAQALNDDRNQAIALTNLGQCAQRLAHLAHERGLTLRAHSYANDALSYFARATPCLAALGMDAESQKIIWAIAGIAQQRGHLEEARAQFLAVREELLRRKMYLTAALVGLDLMELLIMLDRHDLVASWYEEIVATFVGAGMPRYALEALSRVQTVAAERRLDANVLAMVRSSVRERFARAA